MNEVTKYRVKLGIDVTPGASESKGMSKPSAIAHRTSHADDCRTLVGSNPGQGTSVLYFIHLFNNYHDDKQIVASYMALRSITH